MRTKNVEMKLIVALKMLKLTITKTSLENSTNGKDSWNIINELLYKKSKTTSIKKLIIHHIDN